jgi:RNA polymerase sigma-70 factor (ECF subfamily)
VNANTAPKLRERPSPIPTPDASQGLGPQSGQFEIASVDLPRARPSILKEEDASLVAALRRSEPEAAEALYRRLIPVVRRTLWRFLRNTSADQDDLIQITFERVVQTIVDGRFSGACSLSCWAVSIATHAAIDHHRARLRERRLFAEDHPDASGDTLSPPTLDEERSLHARSEVDELMGILSRMKPLDAQALLLRHGFGCSVAEVAARLGASEAATGSRLMRARRELLRRAAKLRSQD